MRERRGGALLLLLFALFVGVVVFAQTARQPEEPGDQEASALVNVVLDKIGVTQKAEVLSWLESEAVPNDASAEETPVWVSRDGTHYHSFPLCGGMKSPVKMTLADALTIGYAPCAKCW